MRRQIIFFAIACAVWGFYLKDSPSQFLEIWFELKAAGKVSMEDYDSTWARFILPKIALFTLFICPVLIATSMRSDKRARGRP